MGEVLSLRRREHEPRVADLIGMAQIHRPVDERAGRGPQIAREYATNPSWELWGYEAGHELLGLVGISPGSDSVVRLQEIAVLPAAQGSGVGRALLGFLDERFPDATIEGDTLEDSAGFYTACGFEVSPNGTLPNGEPVYRFRRRT